LSHHFLHQDPTQGDHPDGVWEPKTLKSEKGEREAEKQVIQNLVTSSEAQGLLQMKRVY
jgi:hypothetical protein